MSLLNSPGDISLIDYFGPISVWRTDNTYDVLVTDRLSRRAAVNGMTAAHFTVVGTAAILVNDFTPNWGRPKYFLSENVR